MVLRLALLTTDDGRARRKMHASPKRGADWWGKKHPFTVHRGFEGKQDAELREPFLQYLDLDRRALLSRLNLG
jgi:hypothetical protein